MHTHIHTDKFEYYIYAKRKTKTLLAVELVIFNTNEKKEITVKFIHSTCKLFNPITIA